MSTIEESSPRGSYYAAFRLWLAHVFKTEKILARINYTERHATMADKVYAQEKGLKSFGPFERWIFSPLIPGSKYYKGGSR